MIKKTLAKRRKNRASRRGQLWNFRARRDSISIFPYAAEFDATIKKMETEFDKPKSLYPLRTARFVVYINETKAEIIVVNRGMRRLDEFIGI